MKEPGSPAARYVTARAFGHPAFFHQLLGNYRYGDPLKTRMPSQIGSGNRLVGPNEIEHYPAIDIARRLARRHLEIAEIYLAHFNAGRLWINLDRGPIISIISRRRLNEN